MKLNPENDGIDHINVYSKGKTALGRFLTNFAHTPINCEDGHFESVEGYWYWLSVQDDDLRKVHGWEAKRLGRLLEAQDWVDDEEFKRKILSAIEMKIRLSDEFYTTFKDSTLPFVHYYVYDHNIVKPKEGKWIMTFLESFRKALNSLT
jgi:hypothetical protein